MNQQKIDQVLAAIDEKRLLETAVALVEVPSPTLSAGAAANRLADILLADGFSVERPVADWPEAPAVVVRFDTGKAGRVLQFDGHLDTVHLPFAGPSIEDGHLCGSGASDMKGGIAAAVEALRALRANDALEGGGVLLTAHDHHEGPWGDRRQLLALIRAGYVGDGVLLPEYLAHLLPIGGRGQAIFTVEISRDGEPVHEVLRPEGLPDVLGAGADLVLRLKELSTQLSHIKAEYVGSESAFVGHIESGEIFNQAPVRCRVEGTRRWVRPGALDEVRREFDEILKGVATRSGAQVEVVEWVVTGDAFNIDREEPLIASFQDAYSTIVGKELPVGAKPFVDDGNSFIAHAGITAITHGPAGLGAHTTQERVPVEELVRVAKVYALSAMHFCR
ncbi:MAG: acetylornithine deacetylase/succinyl-diaminopimelate desuccinylase-like protein [Candidatus Latescibacterota bacterium]|jgi:acetylornithine deacetylase/succinyl-diaminopimelate desuccinylase-like protein